MRDYYHAFVSYHSQFREPTTALVEYLEGSGINVWWDKEILPGDDFEQVLARAVDASACIVVVIGTDGLGPWQTKESDFAYWGSLTTAEGAPKKKMIPVLLPDATISHPNVPHYLRHKSVVKLTGPCADSPQELQSLTRAIYNAGIADSEPLDRPLSQDAVETLLADTIAFYDLHAEAFYEKWKDKLPMGPIDDFVSRLPQDATILDAGCGPGHHSAFLEKRGHRVVGVDLSQGALAIARRHGLRAAFNTMDMRRMREFKRDIFDAVWASGTCIHTPRDKLHDQLWEFIRVLKPGGILGLSVHVEKPVEKKADGRFVETYESIEELIGFLEWFGFEILATSEEITTENTLSTKRVKKWASIRAKGPEDKTVIKRMPQHRRPA